MKKWLSLVALLLACVMMLTACDRGNTEPATTTTEKKPPVTPPAENEVYGYWHSDKASFAFEVLKDTNESKCYSLTAGFYEYYAVQTATYVFDETTGALVLTLEGQDFNFVYDSDEDTLTLYSVSQSGQEYTTEYTREYDAPIQHPSYTFPKYGEMDLSGVLTLPDYKSFSLREIAEAEVRIQLFSDYFSNALEEPTTITDRAAQYGDLVIIDYVGTIDGIAFSGGTASDAEVNITYNNRFIPGFAEGIIGHSIGETFDVTLRFPDNYGKPELAGVEAVFTMTLKTIYDVRLTAEQYGNYKNMLYETYEEWVTGTARDYAGSLAMTMIGEDMVINGDLPEETYMYFYQSYVDYAHYMAKSYGMEYEKFCQIFGYSDSLFRNEAKSVALKYVLCQVIANAEGLTWTDEEFQTIFNAFVKDVMDNSKYTEEEAKEYVTNNQLDNLYAELTIEIVVKWLGEFTFR